MLDKFVRITFIVIKVGLTGGLVLLVIADFAHNVISGLLFKPWEWALLGYIVALVITVATIINLWSKSPEVKIGFAIIWVLFGSVLAHAYPQNWFMQSMDIVYLIFVGDALSDLNKTLATRTKEH